MRPNKNKDKFDYGKYVISYREDRDSELLFLKMKIDNVDDALKEAARLNDIMCHDVLIKTNN